MKRFLYILTIAFISVALTAQPIEAQGRHNNNRENTHSRSNRSDRQRSNKSDKKSNSYKVNRPGANAFNNGNRPGNDKHRPGNDKHRPDNGKHHDKWGNRPDNDKHRPGNDKHHDNWGNRPDNDKHRPGNDKHHNNWNRPGNDKHRPGYGPINRPGNNHFRPNHRPGPNYRPGRHPRPVVVAPPRRPGRPVMRPYYRPVPPPAWRPGPRFPIIRTILGISLGTAINVSLDYLYGNGYAVDGHNNEMVYLRNVPQLNLYWPDATLFYGPNGGLIGSQFMYSTTAYDMARYNAAYNMLCNQYGPPAMLERPNGGYLATWFGNNSYVRLEFQSMASVGGPLRFFTTLSFGN